MYQVMRVEAHVECSMALSAELRVHAGHKPVYACMKAHRTDKRPHCWIMGRQRMTE